MAKRTTADTADTGTADQADKSSAPPAFVPGESNARAVRNPEVEAPADRRGAAPASGATTDAPANQGAAPAGSDAVQPPAAKAARTRTAGKHRK